MRQLLSKYAILIKIVASIAFVVVIVMNADWQLVTDSLVGARPDYLLVVFAIVVFCVVFSAYKWWLLLNIHKIPFSFSQLNRWYFIAMFFNNFLPTSIGGDGFRVFRTYDRRRLRSTAFVVVLFERLSGIIALLVLGWFAAALSYFIDGNQLSKLYFFLGLVSATVFFAIGLIVAALYSSSKFPFPRLPKVLEPLVEHAKDYLDNPVDCVKVVLVSFVFHMVSISWMYLLALSIGAEISYLELAIVSALVGVITVIPLSINGIGLVDGAFIYLVSQYDVGFSHGLSFMILQRFLVLPVSVLGLILYLTDRSENGRPKQTDAELISDTSVETDRSI